MSVVNKMLNDLEQRQRQTINVRNYNPAANNKSSKVKYIVSVCITIVSLSAVGYYGIDYLQVKELVQKNKQVREPSQVPSSKQKELNVDSQTNETQSMRLAQESSVLRVEKSFDAGHTSSSAINNATKKMSGQSQIDDNEILPTTVLSKESENAYFEKLDVNSVQIMDSQSSRQSSGVRATNEISPTIGSQAIISQVIAPKEGGSKNAALQTKKQQTIEQINKTELPEQIFTVQASDGSKSELSNLRAKAHIAVTKGDNATATKVIHEILVLAPNDAKMRKTLAALLFGDRQVKEAKRVLIEGLKIAPNDADFRLMLSRIYFKLSQFISALEVLQKHPKDAIPSDKLLSFRAALAERVGQYILAQQDYEQLVLIEPREARWWLGLGISFDKQGMNQQAIESYRRAQSLNQLSSSVNNFVNERLNLLVRQS